MQARQSLQRIKVKIHQQKLRLHNLRDRLRQRRINVPLVLTSSRFLLAPLIFWAIIQEKLSIGALLFLFASLTDLFDGYIARKYNLETKLGKALDPLADKIIINATAGALVFVAGFPWWVLTIFLLRDVSLIIGWLILIRRGLSSFSPTRISKLTTLFQVLSILSFFVAFYFPIIIDYFPIVIALAVISTLISGCDYARRFYVQSERKIPQAYQFKMLVALPDFFTLGNAAAGFLSIIASFHDAHGIAALLLLVSAGCDVLDGKIARKLHREGSFGKEMDSLADVLSFGVAPAVLAMSMVKNLWYFPLFFFFLACGILRLARYNIMQEQGVFYGVPITISGLMIPLMYFLSLPLEAYPWVFFTLGLAMIAPVRINKVGF